VAPCGAAEGEAVGQVHQLGWQKVKQLIKNHETLRGEAKARANNRSHTRHPVWYFIRKARLSHALHARSAGSRGVQTVLG
jgi:hypothetical protein